MYCPLENDYFPNAIINYLTLLKKSGGYGNMFTHKILKKKYKSYILLYEKLHL